MSASVVPDVSDEVLIARAYLSRVGEPASVGLWALVRELGPIDAVAALRAGRVAPRLLGETAARRERIDPAADLAAAERHGLRLVVPESPDWPHFAFAALEKAALPRAAAWQDGAAARNESGDPMPPLALWVRGPADLSTLGVRSVGIVGSRSATQYGLAVTAQFAYGLAAAGVVVVSGGAYGIDAAAHRAALAAEGTTVIISAAGLDRPYPPSNATLFDRASATGLVISESPPGCAPHRHRFLTRNRLIAAFSTGVVVIEAAARSGATNTAGHARLLGRPLMAVPGPITSTYSAGCHALLQRDPDPAVLVTSVQDVLAVVGGAGEGLPAAVGSAPAGDIRDELDRLDPLSRTVFEGLPARGYARPEEIAVRCGVSPLDVVRTLPTLDHAGLLDSADGGYRIAARVRRR